MHSVSQSSPAYPVDAIPAPATSGCRRSRSSAQRRRQDEALLLFSTCFTVAISLSTVVDSLALAIVGAAVFIVGLPLTLWWVRRQR